MNEEYAFKKHIMIAGKTAIERKKKLDQILDKNDLEIFTFPKSTKSLSDYLNVVRAKKLYFPYNETKGKCNLNQIFDFHIDWIAENDCLFIFEEFHEVEEKFGLEIMRLMINNSEANRNSATKILITLDDEAGLINHLSELVNETEYKTKAQVVESNLHIILL